MHSQLLYGPTVVEGVRPEVASAILEMLALCPRAMHGMCGFQPSLVLRVTADEPEVAAALAAMVTAGLIERIRGTNPIPEWQMSAIPEQRSYSPGWGT